MAEDPLGSHVRTSWHRRGDDGPSDAVSAASFGIGAGLAAGPRGSRIAVIAAVTLVLLATLGVVGARLGGASAVRAALRITVGGGLAMAATALIGALVGTAV
jgi:VIT1/CCC1 family predicted Fe2+/Mn2+ transporter